MDTNEHGCRKGTIYKEPMKTGEERKNSNENGFRKDVEQEETERTEIGGRHGWKRSVNPIQNTHKLAKAL